MRPWQGRTQDDALKAAWQELAAQAKEKPWLLKLLANQGATLAARYALWKRRLERLRQGERRRLQRRLGVGLAGAALLLALAGGPAGASPANTITVSGACDLIEAIHNANDITTGQPYTDCAAGDPAGADSIYLTGPVTLTAPNNVTYGPTGLPVVTSEITIEGNGNTISRDSSASTAFRILAVGAGGTLTLNSATVSGGVATGSFPANAGGGIYAQSAALVVTNSTVSGNAAAFGGGVYVNGGTAAAAYSTISANSADYGGGLVVTGFGQLYVGYATVNGNTAAYVGGGIGAYNGGAILVNSTVSGNSAEVGGGVYVRGGFAGVYGSALTGNTAYTGGGLGAYGSYAYVIDSTIANNTVLETVSLQNSTLHGDGAGLAALKLRLAEAGELRQSRLSGASAAGSQRRWAAKGAAPQAGSEVDHVVAPIGGGMSTLFSYAYILHSTFSGNTAPYGGGLANAFGSAYLINSTFSGNEADVGGGVANLGSYVIAVNNSIIGNSASYGAGGVALFGSTSAILASTVPSLPPNLKPPAIHHREGRQDMRLSEGGRLRESMVSGSVAPLRTSIGGTLLFGNLVSGNTAPDGSEVYSDSGSYLSTYNVFGHDGVDNDAAFDGFTPSGADVTATSDGITPTLLADIVESTLADNNSTVLAGVSPGAPVQTHALPAGSPAIDKAPSDLCTDGFLFLAVDQRHKPRNMDGDGVPTDNECDAGSYELQTEPIPRIIVHKQTLPDGDTTPFDFRLRGPVGRDFALADNQPHSTGLIPAGIYTLEEILPPGWDPAIPLSSLTCDDGSPLAAIDLAADEVLVCRFLNYKRGNIIVKKVTLPAVAAPSFSMRLINNTTLAKTFFSLANAQQFDTGAISSVPTYKLLETLPGGWKRKNIVCDNGSPSTAITVPPGGTVTCTVTNENTAPSNISLSNSSVAENKPIGTLVGNLSATDAVGGDTHTFSFINDGAPAAANNGNFQIAGNQLKTAKKFDFEQKISHNIKLQVTDSAGQTKVKAFVITILDGLN